METSEIYIPLFEDRSRYLILKGGESSGKSYFIAKKLIYRITSETGHRIVVARKVRATVRDSTYQLIHEILTEENLISRFTINKSEFRFTDNYSGSEIVMIGIDDPEKRKGMQGITGAWMEELTEFDELDFMYIDRLIRADNDNYKQLIGSFNPIDEKHWVKAKFFDNPASNVTTSETTYHDNDFLTQEAKDIIEQRYKGNDYLYNVLVLGKWGRIARGGEFYKRFEIIKNTAKLKYNPYLPLHISFDFNVNPYMTCILAQLNGNKLFIFDEICLENPLNTTRAVCKRFRADYSQHDTGLFIYGDPSGKHQDTRSEKGFNDFKIIEQELEQYHPQFRIMSQAPSVVMRGSFINTVFANSIDDIEILVDLKCSNLIDDFHYLKENKAGGKYKQTVTKDGVSFEKYGHCSDAFDYLFIELFKDNYRRFQHGTKKAIYSVGQVAKARGY